MSDTKLLNRSNAVAVRRLEVLPAAGRRRPWTAAQKARIVAESHAEGATVCAVARRHAIAPQLLYTWRRNDARADGRKRRRGAMTFAPVIVTAPTQHRTPVTPAIEVIVGALTVRVPEGVDASTLQLVLRAARAVS